MVGGISLGSAVAVNVRPALSRARPGPGPVAAGVDRSAAGRERSISMPRSPELIRECGGQEGLERFRADARIPGDGTRVTRLRPLAHGPVRAAAGRGMRRAAGAAIRRHALRLTARYTDNRSADADPGQSPRSDPSVGSGRDARRSSFRMPSCARSRRSRSASSGTPPTCSRRSTNS